MAGKVKVYDYLENKSVSSTITLYQENSYDEYLLYQNVSPYFKNLCAENKLAELTKLQEELLKKTKINEKIDKIYGNKK